MVPFSFAGETFVASPEGALHWPAKNALLVADLHLEKASWFARFGQFLPPYDSVATLTALNDVQRRFPDSQYAADARLKADLVNDHLAGKEMEIGRFYERTGQWLAAQLRFQNVVEEYQTTSHTPEALYRLTETNLALGVPTEAQKYAAVLGANYPGSEWYERAYELIREEAPEAVGG